MTHPAENITAAAAAAYIVLCLLGVSPVEPERLELALTGLLGALPRVITGLVKRRQQVTEPAA